MLALQGLTVEFGAEGPSSAVTAVAEVSLEVQPGRTLAVVGESGSGKSITAMALMGLLPPAARIVGGKLSVDGVPVPLGVPPAGRRGGPRLAMIFQEPMTALNPCMTVGAQLVEALTLHQGLKGRAALAAAGAALAEVGISDPAVRLGQYPHEFSGGMAQRVLIAMALACRPAYLLADEPTTALDVTVQAQILGLIDDLRRSRGLGVLLITHDLGVVGDRADAVAVMYAGRVMEDGPARGPGGARGVLGDPRHPYTRALLACAPRLGRRLDRLPTVADLVGAAPAEVATEGGPRRAWWPGNGRPVLRRLAGDPHRRVCVEAAEGEGQLGPAGGVEALMPGASAGR
jgi:ABC-type dipeptide/oligopeptide/nickel transport system ATPase component